MTADEQREHEDEVLSVIYTNIDRKLRAGRFAEVDADLDRVDPGSYPFIFTLAHLSITSSAKDVLKRRDALYQKAKAFIERADPNRAEALLEGLE